MNFYENEDQIPQDERPTNYVEYFGNNTPAEESAPTPPAQDPAPVQESFVHVNTPVQSDAPAAGSEVRHENNAAGRQSPYANSPYTSSPYTGNQNNFAGYYQPQQQYRPTPEYAPVKKVKKSNPFWKNAIAAILAVALVASGCGITAFMVNSRWEKRNKQNMEYMSQQIEELQKQISNTSASSSGAAISGSTVAAGDLMTPGQVYAQNVDSVVAIASTIRTSMYGRVSEGTASGSGFILTDNGFVATNYHVIQDASKVTVITHQGQEYEAKVVGSDSTIDLAVLKIDAENLPAVKLGSSTDLAIGDMVVAIGNPLGELTATQTVGYVSGKNREVTTDNTIISMIQTDAAINPGNSGGPLFNMKGEVVGITTAKYSGTTSGGASIEGIGFAIPMDDIANIISDLKDLGYVTGAYLGVTVKDTDASAAAEYGLPTGAYVVSTVEGGAADRAGIRAKDIIISLGDNTVTSVTGLTRALRSFKAGDTTTVTIIRSGEKLDLSITLDEKPKDLNQNPAPADQQTPEGNYDEWFDYFRRYFGDGKN